MKTNFFSLMLLLFAIILFASSCIKTDNNATDNITDPNNSSSANLIIQFKFDSNQTRLNNVGLPSSLPNNHAAQSPTFNGISAHYIELAPSAFTFLGEGALLYQGPETTAGGNKAVNFDEALVVAEGETFLSLPIKDLTPGTYEHIRVSLSYQNYDIQLKALGFTVTGTLASFIGYNTYTNDHTINTNNLSVNGNRLQGYWAFESPYGVIEGQAPEGATTVPNPLFASSPIPQGSCVVTGSFGTPLQITGTETEDINLTLSLSTNNSFEWINSDGNSTFDPLDGDIVVDMGIRGLIPLID